MLTLPHKPSRQATRLPPVFHFSATSAMDLAALVTATEGFTGADLKRLIDDGKSIYAYDKSRKSDLKVPTEYFLQAVEGVQENKQRFAEAEAQAAMKPKFPVAGLSSHVTRFVQSGGDGE